MLHAFLVILPILPGHIVPHVLPIVHHFHLVPMA